MIVNIFIKIYQPSPLSISRTFSFPHTENPNFSALATAKLPYVSVCLPRLYILYKWNKKKWSFVTSFFHLASHFQGSSIWSYISALHSFLLLNNILLYGYITFCLPIHQLLNIYIFTFLLLIIMLLIQVFMWIYIFISLEYITRSRNAGSCGNSMLNLWGATVFSKVTISIYIPTSSMSVPVSPYPSLYLLLSFW